MNKIRYICAHCKTIYEKPAVYGTADGYEVCGCPKCAYGGADELYAPDRAELRQYLALRRETQRLEERLSAIRAKGGSDAQLLELTENNRLRCKAKLLNIERFISDIDDSLLRQIFTFRYVKGLSWAGVAAACGGYYSPDYVRICHDRYLKRIAI